MQLNYTSVAICNGVALLEVILRTWKISEIYQRIRYQPALRRQVWKISFVGRKGICRSVKRTTAYSAASKITGHEKLGLPSSNLR